MVICCFFYENCCNFYVTFYYVKVAVYQEKLRELESRQTELITENVELKELCLFLDQERLRMTGDRDEGDGSSNGTIAGHEDGVVAMDTNGSTTPTPGISSSNTYSSNVCFP